MAFFSDLTDHTYTPPCGLKLLNVGWLDVGNAYPIGPCDAEFRDALCDLCQNPVFLHRGTHSCWYCRQLSRNVEGNGQIRLAGKEGIWYAAPTLVHHYVTCHEYLPPVDFIDAVNSAIPLGKWKPPIHRGFPPRPFVP
jgi:hypothetical protein